MKKSFLSLALVVALGVSFTSCRDTKKEEAAEASIEHAANTTGEAIEEAGEDAAEATEGALERTGKAIDNVVEETKEAGEAVEKAAKEIDGDGK